MDVDQERWGTLPWTGAPYHGGRGHPTMDRVAGFETIKEEIYIGCCRMGDTLSPTHRYPISSGLPAGDCGRATPQETWEDGQT